MRVPRASGKYYIHYTHAHIPIYIYVSTYTHRVHFRVYYAYLENCRNPRAALVVYRR